MKIAIIGSGNMGGGLGKLWAKANHQVIFSFSRDENKLNHLAKSAGLNATVGSLEEAVSQSEIILIAVWLPALEAMMRSVSSWEKNIIITCVSVLQPDFTGETICIQTDFKISVAEKIQQIAPGAKEVEAFNITFAEIVASNSRQFGEDKPTIFYCGDDASSKAIVAHLIEDCGYSSVDAGELKIARTLETLATAWVQFAVSSQLFPNIALKVLQR